MDDASCVLSLLRKCSVETHELCGNSVPVLHRPAPLAFLRDHVARSYPCLVSGVVPAWPVQRWLSDSYLLDKMGTAELTVAVTPDGRADAVTNGCFAQPAQETMTLQQLLAQLDAPARGVAYASAQNGSLTSSFAPLAGDVPPELDFATAAFGVSPDAVNIWLGNSASVTAFHADPYENMYAVLRGEKIFTLLPPGDAYRLYSRPWPAARYERRGDGWVLEPEAPARRVVWSPVDPHPTDVAAAAAAYPLFFDSSLPSPMEVTVRAGQVLYLPALWHHHVRQKGDRVIAVNWWHDMSYDSHFASLQLKLGLAQLLTSDADCSVLTATHHV